MAQLEQEKDMSVQRKKKSSKLGDVNTRKIAIAKIRSKKMEKKRTLAYLLKNKLTQKNRSQFILIFFEAIESLYKRITQSRYPLIYQSKLIQNSMGEQQQQQNKYQQINRVKQGERKKNQLKNPLF
ncbi:hypothetical protein TTHERM_000399689 (macronuclear) [Tetrahymena thermophila SB210]|uniref:Uncharacterized protein n=1 Tax=Tetrahymena thermophila (strain SB210) TaxID=312017 RepID=W7X5Y0_TETTS|nr:hypothetical protein TTHERM_000399689 [Tetrahymena thermophila SB210]EWS74775.1 hypothetical protein TTHERM_000399689 [Tetrahymena thermophila SB210]|eukprot:XP_012652668.1 hypothetical protein TTHERM_000399689 [Tetrahymena thermophila SB210]